MGPPPPIDTTSIEHYKNARTKTLHIEVDSCPNLNAGPGGLADVDVYWNDSLIGHTDTTNGNREFKATIFYDSFPFKYKVKLVKPGYLAREKKDWCTSGYGSELRWGSCLQIDSAYVKVGVK